MNFKNLNKTFYAHCKSALSSASGEIEKPTSPPTDDFWQLFDITINHVKYDQPKTTITESEKYAAGLCLKKILSYMTQRAEDSDIEMVKKTVLELIVEASKLYSHIVINQEEK